MRERTPALGRVEGYLYLGLSEGYYKLCNECAAARIRLGQDIAPPDLPLDEEEEGRIIWCEDCNAYIHTMVPLSMNPNR